MLHTVVRFVSSFHCCCCLTIKKSPICSVLPRVVPLHSTSIHFILLRLISYTNIQIHHAVHLLSISATPSISRYIDQRSSLVNHTLTRLDCHRHWRLPLVPCMITIAYTFSPSPTLVPDSHASLSTYLAIMCCNLLHRYPALTLISCIHSHYPHSLPYSLTHSLYLSN
jgi:hypothetical protein